jgi:hypothetical protein
MEYYHKLFFLRFLFREKTKPKYPYQQSTINSAAKRRLRLRKGLEGRVAFPAWRGMERVSAEPRKAWFFGAQAPKNAPCFF